MVRAFPVVSSWSSPCNEKQTIWTPVPEWFENSYRRPHKTFCDVQHGGIAGTSRMSLHSRSEFLNLVRWGTGQNMLPHTIEIFSWSQKWLGSPLFAEKFFYDRGNHRQLLLRPDRTKELNLYTISQRQTPAGICFTRLSAMIWYVSHGEGTSDFYCTFWDPKTHVENQNFQSWKKFSRAGTSFDNWTVLDIYQLLSILYEKHLSKV